MVSSLGPPVAKQKITIQTQIRRGKYLVLIINKNYDKYCVVGPDCVADVYARLRRFDGDYQHQVPKYRRAPAQASYHQLQARVQA